MSASAPHSPIAVVSGASGLLGRHVCVDLLGRGFQVRALVRNPEAHSDLPAGVRLGRCDLPEVLDESLLEGAGVFVHCAYATREGDLERAREVNERGTSLVLEASRRAGIRRFVFISSTSAHPDAPSYYARSKHELEGLLDLHRDLVLRPGLILAREGQGLFQRLRDSMRATRVVPLFGGGRQPLQTVHVDDLCAALAHALERDLTGAFNVAEPEALPMVTFLHELADRMGLRCLFVPLPFGPVLAAVRGIERIGVPFPLGSENLRGLQSMRRVAVEDDLARLGLRVRSAEESLDALF